MTSTGTGDGGLVKSRKLWGFVLGMAGIYVTTRMMTIMHTPDVIAQTALYGIVILALYAVGGQALVDSIAKWKGVGGTVSTEKTTTTVKEVKEPE